MRFKDAVIIISFALAGCVTTNATKLATATSTRPPIPYTDVAIYRTAEQVPGKYEEVALLNSSGDSAWSDEATMYKSMQRKAAKLGANAIIMDAVSEPSAGAKVAAALLWWGGADRKGKAIAIFIYPNQEVSKPKKK